jgi:hypothetical protein
VINRTGFILTLFGDSFYKVRCLGVLYLLFLPEAPFFRFSFSFLMKIRFFSISFLKLEVTLAYYRSLDAKVASAKKTGEGCCFLIWYLDLILSLS